MKKRVLIIKTGYSETLDPENSFTVSLGDVLRTTVILHLFPPETYEVTWVTDRECVHLLSDNKFIHRLLVVNPFTVILLTSESFDIIINFEKDLGICSMADRIPSYKRYGFRRDPRSNSTVCYEHSENAIDIISNHEVKIQKDQSWSDLLYGMLGVKYEGQPYILGYKPRSETSIDIGLNHLCGGKFTSKRWPKERWESLSDKLSQDHIVSWQSGVNDLHEYIEWLSSCRTVITNDSLGLHIAIALGKPIVALFGPTIANEVHNNSLLTKITGDDRKMGNITVDSVYDAIKVFI